MLSILDCRWCTVAIFLFVTGLYSWQIVQCQKFTQKDAQQTKEILRLQSQYQKQHNNRIRETTTRRSTGPSFTKRLTGILSGALDIDVNKIIDTGASYIPGPKLVRNTVSSVFKAVTSPFILLGDTAVKTTQLLSGDEEALKEASKTVPPVNITSTTIKTTTEDEYDEDDDYFYPGEPSFYAVEK